MHALSTQTPAARRQDGAAVRPEPHRPPCVVLEEFLVAQELDALQRFAIARAASFRTSEVLTTEDGSIVDPAERRSRVLYELGEFEALFRRRVLGAVPYVLARLGLRPFAVPAVEVQMTVSHDGGVFRPHFDDDETGALGRRLTFVYFFAREPQRFRGGELRLYASRAPDTRVDGVARWHVRPGTNQVVFFESTRLHEVLPVHCPSNAFRDGRFTVNGWIHGRAGGRP